MRSRESIAKDSVYFKYVEIIILSCLISLTPEKNSFTKEKVETLKIIDPLEQDITNFLASDLDLLNNVEPTKKLSDLKKLYDEAVDR